MHFSRNVLGKILRLLSEIKEHLRFRHDSTDLASVRVICNRISTKFKDRAKRQCYILNQVLMMS